MEEKISYLNIPILYENSANLNNLPHFQFKLPHQNGVVSLHRVDSAATENTPSLIERFSKTIFCMNSPIPFILVLPSERNVCDFAKISIAECNTTQNCKESIISWQLQKRAFISVPLLLTEREAKTFNIDVHNKLNATVTLRTTDGILQQISENKEENILQLVQISPHEYQLKEHLEDTYREKSISEPTTIASNLSTLEHYISSSDINAKRRTPSRLLPQLTELQSGLQSQKYPQLHPQRYFQSSAHRAFDSQSNHHQIDLTKYYGLNNDNEREMVPADQQEHQFKSWLRNDLASSFRGLRSKVNNSIQMQPSQQRAMAQSQSFLPVPISVSQSCSERSNSIQLKIIGEFSQSLSSKYLPQIKINRSDNQLIVDSALCMKEKYPRSQQEKQVRHQQIISTRTTPYLPSSSSHCRPFFCDHNTVQTVSHSHTNVQSYPFKDVNESSQTIIRPSPVIPSESYPYQKAVYMEWIRRFNSRRQRHCQSKSITD